MRLSKQCLNLHSWPNYPFKVRGLFKSSNNDANRANKAREVVIYLRDTNVQTGQCMRPPSPPHKDTSWSIPALTYSRTNSYVTLTDLWPSPTLTEPAERQGHHQRGETRQRPVTHPGESHIYLSWMQMTRFGYKLRRQNRGDA